MGTSKMGTSTVFWGGHVPFSKVLWRVQVYSYFPAKVKGSAIKQKCTKKQI